MAIEQKISDFLRDAQYRMAEIANRMEEKDDYDNEFEELEEQRLSLYLFMDCIYIGNWSIRGGGYNHLFWDDYDIEHEMEYLRNYCGMVTSPYITFVGNYPTIVASVGASSGSSIPNGAPSEYIYYDAAGNPITAPFPVFAGATDSDTVETYFL